MHTAQKTLKVRLFNREFLSHAAAHVKQIHSPTEDGISSLPKVGFLDTWPSTACFREKRLQVIFRFKREP